MKNRHKLSTCIFLMIVYLVLFSCKKIKEFEYVEDFEGNFDFTTVEIYENTHSDEATEIVDTFTYYGTIKQLGRDELEITYSNEMPLSTLCYDRKYYYKYMLNVLVDKSGKLELPCTEGIEMEHFVGYFSGLDTLTIELRTRLGEYSTIEHRIKGIR